MKIVKILFVLLITIYFSSCKDADVSQKGEVQIALSFDPVADGRVAQEEPSSLIISVESETGTLVLDEKEISINKFGNGYVSEPVLLEIGEYSVTKFLALNASGEVVYATPITGSILAGLVENPLPVRFDVVADAIVELSLDVIATSSLDPEDLGYSVLSFSVVPVQDILVSVMSQSETGALSFTNSSVTIYGDQDSIYTATLGDSINVLRVRKDFDELLLKFASSGLEKSIYLDSDSLLYHRTVPLTIIFQESHLQEKGLVAYYPFNGNVLDESGNGLNGSVSGAELTEDRQGNANSAYLFSGYTDMIVVQDNDLLDIRDSLTIAAWVNLTSGNVNGSRIVDKAISGTGIGYLLDIYNKNSTSGNVINSIRFIGTEGFTNISSDEISLTNWHHIVSTYIAGEVKLYLDGELISVTQEESTQLSTNDEDLQIGNSIREVGPNLFDPFVGKIDDVRIYKRVLTSTEVSNLYNMQ